jgi:hypothetical protein
MTRATDGDFQRLVIERLDKLGQAIRGLSDRLEKTDTKFDASVKASNSL